MSNLNTTQTLLQQKLNEARKGYMAAQKALRAAEVALEAAQKAADGALHPVVAFCLALTREERVALPTEGLEAPFTKEDLERIGFEGVTVRVGASSVEVTFPGFDGGFEQELARSFKAPAATRDAFQRLAEARLCR